MVINRCWRICRNLIRRYLLVDIDVLSLAAANENNQKNATIAERVQLLPATPDGPILFPLLAENLARTSVGPGPHRPYVTFSMCNPPFYSDVEDIARSADSKEFDPHAVRRSIPSIVTASPAGQCYSTATPEIPRRHARFLCLETFFAQAHSLPGRSATDDLLISSITQVCTGALVEMVTPGGDLNFVRRMLEESLVLQDICG